MNWNDAKFWQKLRYAMPRKKGEVQSAGMLKTARRTYVMGRWNGLVCIEGKRSFDLKCFEKIVNFNKNYKLTQSNEFLGLIAKKKLYLANFNNFLLQL